MNEEFLREFFGPYSRKGGTPRQFILEDADTFLEFYKFTIIENYGCYISINPFKTMKDIIGVEKLYFDFDKEAGVDRAFKDFRIFYKYIEKEYDIGMLKVFSGNKGYNIYMYLPELLEVQFGIAKLFNRALLNILINEFLDKKGKLTLETMDIGCTKDPARIARVPFSIHQKSQRMTKVIFSDDPLQTLKDVKKNTIPDKLIREAMKSVKATLLRREIMKEIPSWRKQRGGVRRCIIKALKDPNVVGGADHQNRIALILDAHFAGWSVNRMIDELKHRADFNLKYTRQTIEDIINREYEYRVSCRTLEKIGVCDSSCPWAKQAGRTSKK